MKFKRVCRVCGKQYEACSTPALKNTFRWQDVSCSPECGAEYLRRIRLSREHDSVPCPVMYNEDYNGFDGEPEEEYMSEFGFDE